MLDVATRTVVERPVDVVAAYTEDPTTAPEWYANISSVTWRTAPPVGVGSQLDFEARFLGRRMAYTYTVTEHVPGERLVMSTSAGPFPMETTYLFRPVGEGRTEVTLRNRGGPSGPARLLAPVMRVAMKRANEADLSRLKAVVEVR